MAGVSAAVWKRLLQSGEFSDCTLVCGGEELKAHQNILSSQSSVLKELCEQGRKKYSSVHLQFVDEELNTLSKVLSYLYTGDYKDDTTSDEGPDKEVLQDITNTSNVSTQLRGGDALAKSLGLRIVPVEKENQETSDTQVLSLYHLKIFFCAHKLRIEPLKALALEKFMRLCRERFPPSDFIEVLLMVYARTSSTEHLDLRTAVTRLCMERLTECKKDDQIMSVIMKHEPVAWNLVEISAKLEESRKQLATPKPKTGQQIEAQESAAMGRLIGQLKGLSGQNERLELESQKMKSENGKLAGRIQALEGKVKGLKGSASKK